MDLTTLADVCVLSVATATISQTTARAKVFEPARDWCKAQNKWLGELAGCPYCTSHWVAFFFVAVYQPRLLHRFLFFDLLVTAFAVVALATLIGAGIAKLTFHGPEEPHKATEFDLPEKAVEEVI